MPFPNPAQILALRRSQRAVLQSTTDQRSPPLRPNPLPDQKGPHRATQAPRGTRSETAANLATLAEVLDLRTISRPLPGFRP